MKKKIALILAACLMLSACAANAEPNQGGDTAQNQGASGNADGAGSNIDGYKDGISFEEYGDYDIVTKPSQPTVPVVDVIPVSKLEYEFVANGDYGPGIKINAINSAAADIRFPETIDGEPVVYISEDLVYSENVKTLIYPDTVADYGVVPETVEFVKLPAASKIAYIPYRTSLKSVYIPDGATSVNFAGCTSLTSIALPDSVTEICGREYQGASGIYFGNDGAFQGCTALTSIYIPDSVTSIGEMAFEGCTALESVRIGNGVTEISNRAFYGCISLENVYIPDSVTDINSCAFCGCVVLENLYIPDSVTYICSDAFDDTKVEKTENGLIMLGNRLIDRDDDIIPSHSYVGSGGYTPSSDDHKEMISVTIPDSITYIGDEVFENCDTLVSVKIPDGVTYIGEGAFSGCESLTSITIPDSVTSIGEGAFYGCESLTSVTIGNGVTEIGESVFDWCESLTSVTIPNSVTRIGAYAFSNCTSLTNVISSGNNGTEISGAAFDDTPWYKNQEFPAVNGVLLGYNGNTSEVTVPDSVTKIGDYAFSDCTSLTSVTIPDSVTSIGDYAFSDCTSLTSVTIPDSVTSIGEYAFAFCVSIQSIDVPDSVSYIGEYALLVGRAAQISSKNRTAEHLRSDINDFLTSADTAGNGMKHSSTASDEIDILVKDGVWSCTALTASNFNGDFKRGSGADGVTSNMNKSGVSSIEELLCIYLADSYLIENASIHVALRAGLCTAVAYTNEINAPMVSGVDYPTITNGEFSETFAWDGETAGLTTSGILVGTAPVVALG